MKLLIEELEEGIKMELQGSIESLGKAVLSILNSSESGEEHKVHLNAIQMVAKCWEHKIIENLPTTRSQLVQEAQQYMLTLLPAEEYGENSEAAAIWNILDRLGKDEQDPEQIIDLTIKQAALNSALKDREKALDQLNAANAKLANAQQWLDQKDELLEATFRIIRTREDAIKDRLFIQEIINDLEKHGYVKRGKAHTMLTDWSRELRDESFMKGKTKRTLVELVGKEALS